jgi:hypothetical protein
MCSGAIETQGACDFKLTPACPELHSEKDRFVSENQVDSRKSFLPRYDSLLERDSTDNTDKEMEKTWA